MARIGEMVCSGLWDTCGKRFTEYEMMQARRPDRRRHQRRQGFSGAGQPDWLGCEDLSASTFELVGYHIGSRARNGAAHRLWANLERLCENLERRLITCWQTDIGPVVFDVSQGKPIPAACAPECAGARYMTQQKGLGAIKSPWVITTTMRWKHL